jgi:hypothetical protein
MIVQRMGRGGVAPQGVNDGFSQGLGTSAKPALSVAGVGAITRRTPPSRPLAASAFAENCIASAAEFSAKLICRRRYPAHLVKSCNKSNEGWIGI